MSETILQINHALQHKIADKIKQNGKISFAEFMKMALYSPGLGYYSAGLNKIGAEGDFVTSPELGALFAQCHANVFAGVLKQLNDAVFLELGAGTGQFCVDFLLALESMDSLPEHYYIIEVSADFKQVQQQKIQTLPPYIQQKIKWLDQPPKQPFEGIIFANEVLDALPVEVFQFKQNQYQQLMLTLKNNQLTEQWQRFNQPLNAQLQQLNLSLSEGYRSEFIPNLDAWIQSVTGHLSKGLAVFVDYGYGRPTYYHPQRVDGTLVCQRRHQANFNPYNDIGLQDITAFVDFTAVAEAFEKTGFKLIGYTTQGDFLVDAGISQHLDPDGDYQNYYQLASEMKHLVLPQEMGEKFKTIAASKNLDISLNGFNNNRWNEL